ncbi:unnamed protein product [Thlaspi arvense]|uniref:Dynamin GTPase effector domain-containing protein n=1 Tax=Thlaspi arvense TaxID=13288 RepID=A0AAU9RRF3_THLAR|nr:unnamed protein product [Thlaspi arvense]
MDIIGSAKESLLRILVHGDFSEFPDNQNMHCTARLADMLSRFSDDLQAKPEEVPEFLMDEIKVLEECKCVGLPNFIPRSAFLAILSQHVDDIQAKPVEFIKKIWDYIEVVLSGVIAKYSENFPQIQSSIKRAGRNLVCKLKEQSVNRVIQIVEMEKLTDYTCNPEYMKSWTEKTNEQESFIVAVLNNSDSFSLSGFGNVKISHLRKYHAHLLQQAFDMKMRITSYWTIVLRRIVDNLALYLQLSVKYLVNSHFQKEIVAEMVDPRGGGGIERMLEESPSVASKREKLNNSIKLLKESKDAVAAIVDQNSGQWIRNTRKQNGHTIQGYEQRVARSPNPSGVCFGFLGQGVSSAASASRLLVSENVGFASSNSKENASSIRNPGHSGPSGLLACQVDTVKILAILTNIDPDGELTCKTPLSKSFVESVIDHIRLGTRKEWAILQVPEDEWV